MKTRICSVLLAFLLMAELCVTTVLAAGNCEAVIRFRVIPVYLDDTKPLGYDVDYGNDWEGTLPCTFSTSHSTNANHQIKISGFHPDTIDLKVREGYEWAGWKKYTISKPDVQNPPLATYYDWTSNTTSVSGTGTHYIYMIYHPNTPPAPQPPETPGDGTVQGLLKNAVAIDCVNDEVQHPTQTYNLMPNTTEKSYDIGPVTGDEANGYSCVITVYPRPYVDAYNTTTGSTHVLDPNTQTGKEITLAWDAAADAWAVAAGTIPVTFTVKCETPEPVPPEEPSYDDLSGLFESAIRIYDQTPAASNGHPDKYYSLLPNTPGQTDSYRLGAVTDQGEGSYSCTITIFAAPYVAKYNEDMQITHQLTAGETSSKTMTLVWNGDAWQTSGTAEAAFQVECGVLVITPADITIYTGGEGHEGIVDENGEIVEDYLENGFPEPGYYITLPDDLNNQLGGGEAFNLSDTLRFCYSDGRGTTREWKLALYGTDEHSMDIEAAGTSRARYIYRLLPSTEEQIPVRLEITDPESGKGVPSDEFTPAIDEQYREYDMAIYAGALDQNLVTAQLVVGGETHRLSVQVDTGKLTVRGVNKETFTEIASQGDLSSIDTDSITAAAPDGVSYYVNGSNVEVADPSGVKLLVDTMLNEEVLTEYIEANMSALLPENGYGYEQQYLNLVDTRNGNAYLTLGQGQTMTMYWPAPEDYAEDGEVQIIHFDALDRNYDGTVEDMLKDNPPETMEQVDCVRINGGDAFTFETGSFSPFVLVYEKEVDYALTVENGSGDGRYPEGEKVTITADAPPQGMVFDQWVSSNGGSFANAGSAQTVFTMPGNDVTVTATYKPAGGGTVDPEKDYLLTVVNGSGDGRYPEGQKVTITADKAPAGMVFYQWVSSNGGSFANAGSAQTIFTMPGNDVIVTAIYRPAGGGTVDPEDSYYLTVINGSGDGWYEKGDQVVIIADDAPEGKEFDHWITSGGGTFEYAGSATTVFTMPGHDVTVTAVYRDKTSALPGGTDGQEGTSGPQVSVDTVPQTGDPSRMALWMALAGMSAVGLAATLVLLWKNRNRNRG